MDLGIHASYYHKLTENQTLGVELEGKGAQGEAVSTVGYSFDIPGADCNIKGEVKFLFFVGCFLRFYWTTHYFRLSVKSIFRIAEC